MGFFFIIGIQRKNICNHVFIHSLELAEVAIVSKAWRGVKVEKGISFFSYSNCKIEKDIEPYLGAKVSKVTFNQ